MRGKRTTCRSAARVLVAGAMAAAVLIAGPGVPALGDEPLVSILAPSELDFVSGTVIVAVEADVGPVSIDYSVDGGATWFPLAVTVEGSTWRAAWDTTGYSGPARIRARSGLSEVVTEVLVDNTVPGATLRISKSRFSPDGDGRDDRTRFTVKVNEAASVRLEVLDRSGSTRRTWGPRAVDPGAVSFRWSGKSDGRRLRDGRYRIRATVVDRVGLSTRVRAPVWIDTRAPRLRILGVTSPTDGGGAVKVRYRVRDGAPRVRLRLQLRDDFGPIKSSRFTRATGRGKLWIKPRYRNGSRLFPGRYRLRLTATDPAANRSSKRARLVVLRKVAPKVYTRLNNTGRKVALTFDDCIFPDEWARILDILKRRRVKATFFCPGDRISMHRSLARRVVREGHTPAAHAWGHPMLTSLPYSQITALLASDRREWASVGGVSAPYFRPPYGAYNSTVLQAAAATFHPRVMMWDVDSRDTGGASGKTLVCNVVCNARPGSIILLHTKPVTAAALPAILDGLEAKGLKPVTLPQLFRAAGHR